MPHWAPQQAILAFSLQQALPFAPHCALPEQQEAPEEFDALVFMHFAASPQHALPSLPEHAIASSCPLPFLEWQQPWWPAAAPASILSQQAHFAVVDEAPLSAGAVDWFAVWPHESKASIKKNTNDFVFIKFSYHSETFAGCWWTRTPGMFVMPQFRQSWSEGRVSVAQDDAHLYRKRGSRHRVASSRQRALAGIVPEARQFDGHVTCHGELLRRCRAHGKRRLRAAQKAAAVLIGSRCLDRCRHC